MMSHQSPTTINPTKISAQIRTLLDVKNVDRLVDHYFRIDDASPFAGITFDQLGENPDNRVIADDLLAVTLLDVSFGPAAVRRLLAGHIDEHLALIPNDIQLWQLHDNETAHHALDAAWMQLVGRNGIGLPGAGRTKASKLLARKRPHLVPIRDSVVEAYFGLNDGPWWTALGEALADETLRGRIEAIRPCESISVLRVLDVVVWMLCSRSKNAVTARSFCSVDFR